MTIYTEQWCERYCTDTVYAIRSALADVAVDVDHELDYPDQYPHGTDDQIPTISHEIMYTDPETDLAHLVWTPRDGWGYYLDGEYRRGGGLRSMGIPVDENPSVVAAEVRRLVAYHGR